MIEGCISGSIHFVMMVNEDEGPDPRTWAANSAIDYDSWTMTYSLRPWNVGGSTEKLITNLLKELF